MKLPLAIAFLLAAAVLEAGGDALVRMGLIGAAGGRRIALFLVGAGVLFAYGYFVNSPKWDFGRLIGVYVVFFFLVAQAINWGAFHQRPAPSILLGGLLIVAGGLVITFWRS